jgi:hypothetical protein|tara:strand:- start:35 stop:391 length:357 start_codon:yes stop_codon:yes gene_type:complete
MATIKSSINSKKLFKTGGGSIPSKNADGEILMSTSLFNEIDGATDIENQLQDPLYVAHNKHLIKEIETLRLEVEELHAFVKDFMGTSSTKGATGSFDATSGKTTKSITVDKGVITQIK